MVEIVGSAMRALETTHLKVSLSRTLSEGCCLELLLVLRASLLMGVAAFMTSMAPWKMLDRRFALGYDAFPSSEDQKAKRRPRW